MAETIVYSWAASQRDYETGKKLFIEYANFLNVDLSFQNFQTELDTLDEQYAFPHGGLLIVYRDEDPIGCAGIRMIDEETAELKRMYVQSEFRRLGIGAGLLERCISRATQIGYKKIRLDTLESMTAAQRLYHEYDFKEIPPYRYNPLKGTVYMEKDLISPTSKSG